MSNQAAVLKEAKAPLTIEERPIRKPAADEMLVRTAAVATNPVDWKMQSTGYAVESYPTILGSDVAGTVEEVGADVTHFKKGDRVTGFARVLASKNPDHGAFQQYTILQECASTKLPESMSFEEASILPMSIATAGVGLFLTLSIPRPPTQQRGPFLIWGASSSVGSAVVQITKTLGYTPYAVCSPRHATYIRTLGAHSTFDYNDSSIVQNITQALKTSNQHLTLAYDAISEHGSSPLCAEILSSFGEGGKLCTTLPYPDDATRPANVEITNTFAARVTSDAQDLGRWLFNEWLEKALAEKSYVPSPAIEKVEGGLLAVQKALDIHKKGVSGKKLVVSW